MSSEKNDKTFYCSCCDTTSPTKAAFAKHVTTQKHKNNLELEEEHKKQKNDKIDEMVELAAKLKIFRDAEMEGAEKDKVIAEKDRIIIDLRSQIKILKKEVDFWKSQVK